MRSAKLRGETEGIVLKTMIKPGLLIPAGLIAAAAGLSVLVSNVSPLFGEEAVLEAVRNAEVPVLDWLCRSLDCLGSRWIIVASVLALSAVLWVRGRRVEALGCLLIIPLEFMTLGLREVIDRPRPLEWTTSAEWTNVAPSPGFPSGTTLHAVLFFGFIAYIVHVYVGQGKLRLALQGALVGVIAVISYSRVNLGVHWPTDVVGAWLYGGVFLWVIIAVGLPLLSRLRGEPPPSPYQVTGQALTFLRRGEPRLTAKCVINPVRITPISIFPRQGGRGK